MYLAHLLFLFLFYIFSSFLVSVKGFHYAIFPFKLYNIYTIRFTRNTIVITFDDIMSLSLSDLSDELTEFWFVFSFDLYLSFFFPFDVPFSLFPLISVIFCFCFLILIGIPNKELKSFWTGRFRDIFALKPISKSIYKVVRISKRYEMNYYIFISGIYRLTTRKCQVSNSIKMGFPSHRTKSSLHIRKSSERIWTENGMIFYFFYIFWLFASICTLNLNFCFCWFRFGRIN